MDLEEIKSRKLVGKVVSSGADKTTIDGCVRKIQDVIREVDLDSSLKTQCDMQEVQKGVLALRSDIAYGHGRVGRVVDVIMVSLTASVHEYPSSI